MECSRTQKSPTATRKLSLKNSDSTITLSPDTTKNLTGNLKFKVYNNATSLKFYPANEPRLNITASPATVPSDTSVNVIFSVTANGLPVSGATVSLSGAAVASGITGADGRVTKNINASYIGTITAEAEKTGYAKGTTTLEAAYSTPVAAMASWNVSENYVLNLIDIDAMAYPRQARFQLLKDNKMVDDAVLTTGQRYYYNSSDFTIFTAEVDTIFNGHRKARQACECQPEFREWRSLSINASHLFKSGIFPGIDWQLNESYNLRMMDIDYSYPRQVYFELLKSTEIKDDVVLSSGQTYIYNNSTNSRILEGTVDVIFSGMRGILLNL